MPRSVISSIPMSHRSDSSSSSSSSSTDESVRTRGSGSTGSGRRVHGTGEGHEPLRGMPGSGGAPGHQPNIGEFDTHRLASRLRRFVAYARVGGRVLKVGQQLGEQGLRIGRETSNVDISTALRMTFQFARDAGGVIAAVMLRSAEELDEVRGSRERGPQDEIRRISDQERLTQKARAAYELQKIQSTISKDFGDFLLRMAR